MGDALAICLLEMRNFSSKDFARYHPGGTLGKKLYLRVGDLLNEDQKPRVTPETPVKDVIYEISDKRLGTTAVVEADRVVGIITDGDIRRMLEKTENITHVKAADIMTRNPKTILADDMAVKALEVMQQNDITQILVLDGDSYAGIVHFHDLLKEGII